MNDRDFQEFRRRYPKHHPLRQMLSKAFRNMGTAHQPSAEETRLRNSLMNDREMVSKAIRAMGTAHQPSAEETRLRDFLELVSKRLASPPDDKVRMALKLAWEFRERESKLESTRKARDRQKNSAAARHKNLEPLTRALCDEYIEWKKIPKNKKLSPEEFHKELTEHLPKRLRFFSKQLKPRGKLITSKHLRNKLRSVLQAK